jgi:hypothetical protein
LATHRLLVGAILTTLHMQDSFPSFHLPSAAFVYIQQYPEPRGPNPPVALADFLYIAAAVHMDFRPTRDSKSLMEKLSLLPDNYYLV